jgi:hypothetical protein
MKREDIEKLLKENGVSEDRLKSVTDSIMDVNGKDIERYKQEATGLRDQLTNANATIEKFKEIDVEQIKREAEDYKSKFEQAERDSQAKLDKLQFDHALDRALTSAKAKNSKAVRAMLTEDVLKLDGEKILGLDDQIEKLKKSDAYLFEDDNKTPHITAKTSGFENGAGGQDKNAEINAALRGALGRE